MLMRFTVENYLSMRDRVEFSMIPGKAQRLKSHIYRENKSDIPALKGSVIYGANASGKSNLIKAIDFARKLVIMPESAARKLIVSTFKLGGEQSKPDARFEFELKAGGKNYAFGFIVNSGGIVEEWLFEIGKNKEKPIYERVGTKINLKGFSRLGGKKKQFLEFTAKGTPKTRLFITECRERNVFREVDAAGVKSIEQVFRWFLHSLTVIFPNSKYRGLELDICKNEDVKETLSLFLKAFDTGIEKLELKEVDFDSGLTNIPQEIKEDIQKHEEDSFELILSTPGGRRYLINRESIDSPVKAYKLLVIHRNQDGEDVAFEVDEESDGTQRLMDLIPGFLEVFGSDKVYIIDEMDRSLHPDITVSIFKNFFALTENRKSQLIATTHETNLLNQEFLRKDEVWFVQKTKGGSSELYSLEEFNPRYDKEIRRSYLNGRFGAVPLVKNFECLSFLRGANGA